uniref:Transcobalamin-like C-terminal domain-containing protein n=1 Tax=Neogobius melanostomus TaxID=47308 RepID=A0A8C6SAG0_9GOBI
MYIYGFSSIIFKLHKSLLLTLFCFLAPHSAQTNITIVVTNSLTGGPKRMYSTYTVYRGILIGAMRRLQETNEHFNFTYSEDSNYGPYLESVNGLAGNFAERTYWQLKVKKPNGVVIIPNVGIGCYIPTTNDEIIFNFTSY